MDGHKAALHLSSLDGGGTFWVNVLDGSPCCTFNRPPTSGTVIQQSYVLLKSVRDYLSIHLSIAILLFCDPI